jgi:hypothetical protein
MGEWYFRIIPQGVNDLEGHNVTERIETAVGAPPILMGEAGDEELGSIPVTKLALRNACEALYLIDGERADYTDGSHGSILQAT